MRYGRIECLPTTTVLKVRRAQYLTKGSNLGLPRLNRNPLSPSSDDRPWIDTRPIWQMESLRLKPKEMFPEYGTFYPPSYPQNRALGSSPFDTVPLVLLFALIIIAFNS